MKFKVNKIAAAVAVSLGTSVVGMNVAQADEILFPYVVASDTVTTILSVINDDNDIVPVLHYRYYYKRSPDNTAACAEADYSQPTSPNDVVTFDISGHFGNARSVLFEPTSANAIYNKDFAIFRTVKPVRAFGLIDNDTRFVPGRTLYGEAFVIQFTEGSVWGYQAYNAANIAGQVNGQVVVSNPFDFSDRVEVNGEVMVAPPPGTTALQAENFWAPIAIMPFVGEVTTTLFVTPIATAAPFQLNGATAAVVGLQVNDPENFAPDVMYDRDENPYSGQVPQPVVCVGRVDVPTMISEATRQFVAATGGWSNVRVIRVAGFSDQAVVMKLEYNDRPPATLDGKLAGGGSYNNNIWLRKGFRESLARVPYPGQANVSFLPTFAIPQDNSLNSPYPYVDVARLPATLPWPPTGRSATDYINFASSDKQ